VCRRAGERAGFGSPKKKYYLCRVSHIKNILLKGCLAACLWLPALLTPGTVAAQNRAGTVMKGKASYYAKKFHGRRMSNGRIYRNENMTCAHRKLPFGTFLKVRNPRNGKEVVVEVTDRGPFIRNRIIDLSHAAAKELGMLHAGVAMVEITILGKDRKVLEPEVVEEAKPEMMLAFDLEDEIIPFYHTLFVWEKHRMEDPVHTPTTIG